MLTDLPLSCLVLFWGVAALGLSGCTWEMMACIKGIYLPHFCCSPLSYHPATPVPLTQPDPSSGHASLIFKPQKWEAELIRA